MFKKLFKNFGIKLLCVFIASILWVYTSSTQNSVAKLPGSIAIKAINVPSGSVAVYDTKTVEIKIMAESAVWKKLSTDSFTAYVDLSNYKEGTHEVNVTVSSSIAGVTIVEKTPDKIFVSLESIATKDVGLNKKVEGNAGDGFAFGGAKFDVDEVKISGPKSVIDSLSEATVRINLDGEELNFDKSFPIYIFDASGEIDKSITISPAEVMTRVTISKAANSKTVGVKVITSGQVKTGYYISNITTDPLTVDIIGAKELVSVIKYLETDVIDLTNIAADTSKDVTLRLPTDISLTGQVANKVRVNLSVALLDSTKELTLSKAEASNLSGYNIAGLSDTVKIVCSGPIDIVKSLTNSVPILLDFKGKTISGTSSTVPFDNLTAKNFKLPDGVTVVSILPSSISVDIIKQ